MDNNLDNALKDFTAILGRNTASASSKAAALNQYKDEEKHLWRKQYLQKSFYLVGFVLYFSLLIVVLAGVGLLDLPQAVVMTLLGSTVAEVVGILLVAFNWLYPSDKESQKDRS